jgi:hypothetical protein
MECLDCALKHAVTTAVAVCVDCGAGVCVRHAQVSAHHRVVSVGLGGTAAVEPAAREVRCDTCHAAYRRWCQLTAPAARHRTGDVLGV